MNCVTLLLSCDRLLQIRYEGRPPTHSKPSFSTVDFFRVASGKIAEHWDVVNVLPRMIALGQIQPPASAPKKPR
jgi:hypothetical protein